MPFPANKTKLVCTIGPASAAPEMMARMLEAGMNVARLNFSHGDFADHAAVIERLRGAARTAGKRLTIMADLPGPKMRIGQLREEPIELVRGEEFTLTTAEIVGDRNRASVSFERLPAVVKPGDAMFLNDGIIRLEVQRAEGCDVHCRVAVGGELRSRKGLNLPGIDLGISAFTAHDHECLKFALQNGADAVGQSFVESAADVAAVRSAAAALGYHPFIVAKIERAGALARAEEIIQAADGVMIARGDLGVEIPVETMAVVQMQLTLQANLAGKPVITATQMLESMVEHCRPTRAEATDVANAILYGTDCVMLSEESAMGKYPVEAVAMLARIAAATEPHRTDDRLRQALAARGRDAAVRVSDLIALNVRNTVEHAAATAVVVPTHTGYTARMISRFKLPLWVTAVSRDEATCQGLQFSYGVFPVCRRDLPHDWNAFAREWLAAQGVPPGLVVLTSGPSHANPAANHRLEILDLGHCG
jgi:pyruvate kinase